jgi:oligopeptide transport system permease protein
VIQAVTIYLAVLTMVINLHHRPGLQGGRSAGGAQMSAVLPPRGRRQPEVSEGVWHAAWRRFKADRVGMVSLVIVAGLPAADRAAAAGGLVASHWQHEVGVPNAPPTLRRTRAARGLGASRCPRAPTSTCPTSTRWRRATRSGTKRAASTPDRGDGQGAETLPFGADRLGRDVLAKAVKGTEISVFVGVMRGAGGHRSSARCWAPVGGFFGGKVGDFLEWVYNVFDRHPQHPADLRLCGGLRARRAKRGADPGLTGWTGMYRQVRAEFMKHRSAASTCARPRPSAPATAAASSSTSCPTSAT